MTPEAAPQGARVLILGHERLGPQMAGPAIRCWELARTLADEFQVTLAAPGGPPPAEADFEWLPVSFDDESSLTRMENLARQQVDVVIASQYLIHKLPFLREMDIPLVADAYIPEAVESLAWHLAAGSEQQARAYRYSWAVTRSVARHADLLVCASERQRDFWLGVLAAYGRLRPGLYTADPHLGNLVAVVPFGCSSSPPQSGPAIKGVWTGIAPQDQVILWGGGVWNWFDPITLLQAMPRVVARHPMTRLVFLGANHPDSARIPEMKRAQEARALSRKLGLEGRSVFWGNWVPYTERGAYLLDADIGVCLHRKGVEARLAFRTRLLDAIWAELPMVLTTGDVLSAEFEALGVGLTVEPGAVEQVARAINALLDEGDPRAPRRSAFRELQARYDWDRVAEPLKRFCAEPRPGPGKQEAQELIHAQAREREAAIQEETARLKALVDGYESGRVMRTLAALHNWRRRLLGR